MPDTDNSIDVDGANMKVCQNLELSRVRFVRDFDDRDGNVAGSSLGETLKKFVSGKKFKNK